ncbi:Sua5/YciO/YrdC/YwlC family protein [Lewinella sp. IMCC34183]|uniref:Sua5/YciO/YrdC/YwlC family protein n=1 Tax=Lewinella sp. IMCC34183 TaxID=2248762 RepID=UPI001300682B|nr:Sua5/YciO/YrdC/YwlC family protein [Lewinella sp. IMCC34183]
MRGTAALAALRAGGLLLLPTANLWQLTADATQHSAVDAMLQTCPPTRINRPELIFPDRATLMAWFPDLHPKLDTLLLYHGRALTVSLPASRRVPLGLVDARDEVNIRLAMDSFCVQLTEDLEGPLAACFAMGHGQKMLPTRFGQINSDVLYRADHTVTRRQKDTLGSRPAVRVRMDGDELQFL